MAYESPIKLIETMTENIVDETNKAVDEYIYKSILNVGVDVDRNELIRALRYDREQYEKGYRDGQRDIVRCGDCKWYKTENCSVATHWMFDLDSWYSDWFCADGERRSDN